MSEDNDKTENLYYYSNKGKQYTFNLDDLTTEELKKFEKMTERQRLKFITNFELQREAPFQDNVSLKPIMTEAKNEKYGDYALLKAKLDEVEKLINSDKENYSNAENFSIVTKDGKKILSAYLEDFRYITEEDVRNCMKAFDMNQATLEMLKKYYKRKIESIDLPGIKSSFLDSLKKFYKNLIDENNREKFKIEHLEDKYENDIKNLTIDDITEQTTEERIKELQNQLKQLVKSLIKKMDITDKKIIKYVDAFEWEKVQKFAEEINNEELKKLLNEYLEVEDKGTNVISPEIKEKDYEETEKPEVLEKKEDEKIETKEEDEKIETEEEEKEEETKEEETKEELDINTPLKRRENELDKNLEKQVVKVLDSLLKTRNLIRHFYEKKQYPIIENLFSKETKNDFGSEIKEYLENGRPFLKIINEKPLFSKVKFNQYTSNKPDSYYEVVYDKENNTTNITLKNPSSKKIIEINYVPTEGKVYYNSDKNKATIKYTRYGKGYKIKYTSGSIIDKIRDKFLKNVNSEINELKSTDKDLRNEDRNIYSKLDSLQKQIEELKNEMKNEIKNEMKNEIKNEMKNEIKNSLNKKPEIPTKPKFNFLDDISNPKPLKPVEPKEKPKEELTDLQKALIDRRKDIEYSEDDEDSDTEWGEGVKTKNSKNKRRMEILDFLNSLEN
jgi:hypothetical protein